MSSDRLPDSLQTSCVLHNPAAKDHGTTLTTVSGAPVGENKNSLTAGPLGPVVMTDYPLIEKINHFAWERDPPRNVHALGYGGFGKFTCTNDAIKQYSSAALFSKAGNSCEIFCRFSGVFTERGDADTLRDLRGFAVKFYTEEGNWDLLCVNTPAFNARDMKVGPDAIHAFKRDCRTGEWYGTQTWDFVATHPEALQTQLMIYTDRVGTPMSMRAQNWFPCNTFSFTNDKKERVWIRFHFISQQGWLGMSQEDAAAIGGVDPNFLSREVRTAVERGDYPRWKLSVQIMPEADGYKLPIAFDCTKVWPHDQFPLMEIGELVIDRWPDDYHTTVEQSCFSPARVIPGIGFSPDKLLAGRLPLYDATQRHRLGPYFNHLPINCPFASKPNSNHSVGGLFNGEPNKNRWPHYGGSLYGGYQPDPQYAEAPHAVPGAFGPIDAYNMVNEGSDDDYYLQPRRFLESIQEPEAYQHLINNLGASLSDVEPRVIAAILNHFRMINPSFEKAVSDSIQAYMNGAKMIPGKERIIALRAQLGTPLAPPSIGKVNKAAMEDGPGPKPQDKKGVMSTIANVVSALTQ